jgi:membrane fusion protein (multidrug efflux system)
MTRSFFHPLVLPVVLALALAGCNEKKPAAGPGGPGAAAPPPPQVGYQVMQLQSADVMVELAGRVAPSLIAEVRPQVSGIIEKRLFTEGAEVKEGDTLYQIADASYRATQASAQASLDRAKAAVVAAQAKADRYRTLERRDIASTQDTESAVAAAQQANADVAAAKAALDAANINSGYTKVRAPISGRIGVSALTEGALVTANQSNALATIQSLDPVYVDAPISSAILLDMRAAIEAGRMVSAGNGVKVRLMLDDGRAYAQEGVLRFTDVTVNQGTGTVTLRAAFANPDRLLLPNMFVRAVATFGRAQGVVLAPQRAVNRDPRGQATALVIGEGDKIEARVLTVGRSLGSDWIVESGLSPGDRLVMDGFQRARPGATVRPALYAAPGGPQPPVAGASGQTPAATPNQPPPAGAAKAEPAKAEAAKPDAAK